VKQQNSLFRAISLCRRFEEIDQLHQRTLEAEDRISAFVDRIGEKVIADVFLFELGVILGPVAEDHVVHALKGIAADGRMLDDNVEVFQNEPSSVARGSACCRGAYRRVRLTDLFSSALLTLRTKLKPARLFVYLKTPWRQRVITRKHTYL